MKLMTTQTRKSQNAQLINPTVKSFDPMLQKVLHEAHREHQRLQEVFDVMGWSNLPEELKIEVKDDVQGMVDELEGRYSSCDPHVHARRKRVVYWINVYRDGICSLQTAVDAVKIRG